MEILKKLIKFNFTPDANTPVYIVIHDTGNTSKGANATEHFNYFNEQDRQSSAHFFVDSNQIIQTIEVKDKAWHIGDGHDMHGINNSNSIGVEICINSDGDYSKTIVNAKNLVILLMQQYGITIDKVVRHYDASGKNCPQTMNDNGDWTAWVGFKKSLTEGVRKVEPITDINVAFKVLVDKGIIDSPEYWIKVAAIVKYFDIVVLRVANKLR